MLENNKDEAPLRAVQQYEAGITKLETRIAQQIETRITTLGEPEPYPTGAGEEEY